MKNWEAFDPRWLVELAIREFPDRPELASSLSRCTKCWSTSPAYIHFVDPDHLPEPKSLWTFDTNLVLEHPEYGDCVLDVLRNGEIGGVEFLSRIEG